MIHPMRISVIGSGAWGSALAKLLAQVGARHEQVQVFEQGVERTTLGKERGDIGFLQRVTHKLLMNYTWWLNRKDSDGNNVFEGGFLGLDNISVYDRSQPLPAGYSLKVSRALLNSTWSKGMSTNSSTTISTSRRVKPRAERETGMRAYW